MGVRSKSNIFSLVLRCVYSNNVLIYISTFLRGDVVTFSLVDVLFSQLRQSVHLAGHYLPTYSNLNLSESPGHPARRLQA